MKLEKVYILLEKVFNYDGMENTDSYINGVFKNLDDAKNAMQNEIKHNIKDFDFVEDTLNAIKELSKIIFYDYQENWQNYIEFEIIEKEVL